MLTSPSNTNQCTAATPLAPHTQEYVRARLLQFVGHYNVRLAQLQPALGAPGLLERLLLDTVRGLPQPDYGSIPLEQRQLQLVFRHDCQ